ncbi:MAG: metal-sulfur cluster assembly factor [Campylobacterales bacterium]|nr:metal-sulfur cluster assembly factor [Campylobacterales bacterium]
MLDKEDIYVAISSVIDPEVGCNLVELGLIYDATISSDGVVHVTMTLSTRGCPLHIAMQQWVKEAVEKLEEVKRCDVEIVWEPAWNITMAAPHVRSRFGA